MQNNEIDYNRKQMERNVSKYRVMLIFLILFLITIVPASIFGLTGIFNVSTETAISSIQASINEHISMFAFAIILGIITIIGLIWRIIALSKVLKINFK